MKKLKTFLILSVCISGLLACSGDTDGGRATDGEPSGGVFVSGDGTTGRIKIVPNKTTMEVGEVVGYKVFVTDASGQPVPNIQIAFGSERGLAIIEPTRGFELANEQGMMSGKVGCEVPGSLHLVARLPIGGNLRDFVEFICTGDVPTGFVGFPGAAGGDLGGGVQVSDGGSVGGTNPDGVRISQIVFIDNGSGSGSVSNASIDTTQLSCLDATNNTSTPEVFYDTYVSITVKNNTNQSIQFTKITYSVDDADAAGTQVNSKDISLVGSADSAVGASGDEATLTVPIFNASGGRKYYAFSDPSDAFPIPVSLGFRNITFRVIGQNAAGTDFTITGRASASFGSYNFCPAGTVPQS